MKCLICDEDVEDGLTIRFRYGVVKLNKATVPYFFPIEMGDGTEVRYGHKICVLQDSITLNQLGEVYEPCPLCRRDYSIEGGHMSPGETVLEVLRGHLYESGEDLSQEFTKESGGYACFDCTTREWRGVTQQIMNLHNEAPF